MTDTATDTATPVRVCCVDAPVPLTQPLSPAGEFDDVVVADRRPWAGAPFGLSGPPLMMRAVLVQTVSFIDER